MGLTIVAMLQTEAALKLDIVVLTKVKLCSVDSLGVVFVAIRMVIDRSDDISRGVTYPSPCLSLIICQDCVEWLSSPICTGR